VLLASISILDFPIHSLINERSQERTEPLLFVVHCIVSNVVWLLVLAAEMFFTPGSIASMNMGLLAPGFYADSCCIVIIWLLFLFRLS